MGFVKTLQEIMANTGPTADFYGAVSGKEKDTKIGKSGNLPPL